MSVQIDRILQIILMIPQEPRAITRIEIQNGLVNQRFTVTDRMVQRDLETLLGVFVGKLVHESHLDYANRLKVAASDEDKSHRYYWQKNFKELKLVGLNINQALILQLMSNYLVSLIPKTTLDDLNPLFEEAKKVLDYNESNPLTHWSEKIAIIQPSQPLLYPEIEPNVQHLVGEALLSERQLHINYRHHNGVINDYQIHPIGLVLRNGSHYLIAQKGDTEDKWQFALHRIRSIAISDLSIDPKISSLAECLDNGQMLFNLTGTEPYGMIQFKGVFDTITANHLSESRLSEDQIVTQLEEGLFEISATVLESEQLLWWLLSFGDRVEVKSPDHLRKKIKETARRMSLRYQDPG